MKRGLSAALLLLVVGLSTVPARASNHDLTVNQFFLPATNTSGYRVHATRQSAAVAHMNVTIPLGTINAMGGYKTPLPFAHVAAASLTNSAISTQGGGTSYQRLGAEGSIIGISISAGTNLTAGTATCEPTILRSDGNVYPTELTVQLSLPDFRRFRSVTQARGRDVFRVNEAVGAYLTTSATFAPLQHILCTVIAEF